MHPHHRAVNNNTEHKSCSNNLKARPLPVAPMARHGAHGYACQPPGVWLLSVAPAAASGLEWS